ncbi:MAG: hypothetical protein AAB642_01890, partial [Patescibacteria group bacterium]
EAMGLWYIVAMHEPINDSGGGPNLLDADRSGDGRWLSACDDRPGSRWYRDGGFAFRRFARLTAGRQVSA